ncbi:unnamed protein product, partial [Mycena citricolor]
APALTLSILAVNGAPVPATERPAVGSPRRLDPIEPRPHIDDYMRRTSAASLPQETSPPASPLQPLAPKDDLEYTASRPEDESVQPKERGCRYFLCL